MVIDERYQNLLEILAEALMENPAGKDEAEAQPQGCSADDAIAELHDDISTFQLNARTGGRRKCKCSFGNNQQRTFAAALMGKTAEKVLTHNGKDGKRQGEQGALEWLQLDDGSEDYAEAPPVSRGPSRNWTLLDDDGALRPAISPPLPSPRGSTLNDQAWMHEDVRLRANSRRVERRRVVG